MSVQPSTMTEKAHPSHVSLSISWIGIISTCLREREIDREREKGSQTDRDRSIERKREMRVNYVARESYSKCLGFNHSHRGDLQQADTI